MSARVEPSPRGKDLLVPGLRRVRTVLVAAALLAVLPIPSGPDLAFTSAALAQGADVTLENVRLNLGEASYAAPRMVIRGTSLSQAEWTRLLDPASPDALPDRVARLQARTIECPELVAEVTSPQGRQRTTYRNVRIDDVGAGRIASIKADEGIVSPPDQGGGTGRFGRIALENFDIGRSVALFYGKGAPGEVLQRIYGSFSIDDLTLDDGKGVTTRIGRMTGRDLAAKPTSSGWLGTINTLAANPDFKAGTPEQRRAGVAALGELFESVSFGSLEMTDLSFAPADRTAGSGRVGRVAFTGATPGRPAELRLDGLEGGSPGQGKVKVSSLAFGGLSMKPILDTMGEDLSRGPPQGAEAVRRLFAMIGSLRVAGVDAEMPEGRPGASADGPSSGRSTRFGLGQFELVTGAPVDGLPSDIRLTLRNVAVPIPANPTDSSMKEIASLGYDRLDASVVANLGWNEPGREIVLRELSVDGADMGSAVLRGVVGNITRDAFNADTAVASVALLGAAAKSAEVTVENRGLFERIIAREARRQKRPPEDIRREYGMAAAIGIPAVLGNSPAAKALSQAVARFVAKPGRLVIRARARQNAGYGAADFAAAPDPASILNALEITATAE